MVARDVIKYLVPFQSNSKAIISSDNFIEQTTQCRIEDKSCVMLIKDIN